MTRQVAAPASDQKESRGSRRKRETREKLLEAAMELMAERGMGGVAINEITEKADVGFGTFYNHFPDKQAIYDALIRRVFDDFADDIDFRTRGMSDPAEVLAFSIQLTMRRAASDLLWGRFLIRESMTPEALTRGLGRRLLRDALDGIQQGRFTTQDPVAAFISTAGTAVAGVLARQITDDANSPLANISAGIDSNTENLEERVSTAVLLSLGIHHQEARKISEKVAGLL